MFHDTLVPFAERQKIFMKLMWNSINEFVMDISKIKEKIYIFGAGTYGKIFGIFLEQNSIEWKGYIDNNKELRKKIINGKKIYLLNELSENENIVVIISVLPLFSGTLCEQIFKQLLEFGVPEDKIIRLSEDTELTQKIVYWSKKPENSLDKLVTLKNKYKNKRCFLIGNGPSLKIEDLKKLEGEVSLGCNGLFQLCEMIKWKPTVFYFGDQIYINNCVSNEESLRKITDTCEIAITTISNYIYDEYRDKIENLYFLCMEYNKKGIWFEEDITKGVCPGGTSLYALLQLIVYMGIKEIYLLGVDFNFKRVVYADGREEVNKEVVDHAKGISQIKEARYEIDTIRNAWMCAKEYAEIHDIKIYNATRGGKLEIFERVDFDLLFCS